MFTYCKILPSILKIIMKLNFLNVIEFWLVSKVFKQFQAVYFDFRVLTIELFWNRFSIVIYFRKLSPYIIHRISIGYGEIRRRLSSIFTLFNRIHIRFIRRVSVCVYKCLLCLAHLDQIKFVLKKGCVKNTLNLLTCMKALMSIDEPYSQDYSKWRAGLCLPRWEKGVKCIPI